MGQHLFGPELDEADHWEPPAAVGRPDHVPEHNHVPEHGRPEQMRPEQMGPQVARPEEMLNR